MAVFTGLGSAASPSITFSADTNTGIFSPGADQVAVATNGTGRLFVDASGNVSLTQRITAPLFNTAQEPVTNAGTNIPFTPQSGGYSRVSFDNASAGSNGATFLRLGNVSFPPNASASWIGAVYNGNFSSNLYFYSGKKGNNSLAAVDSALNAIFSQDEIRFYTGVVGTSNTSERLRITSTGNVGIGTSSPSQPLHVNGRALIRDGQFYLNSVGTITTNASGDANIDLLGFSFGSPSLARRAAIYHIVVKDTNRFYVWTGLAVGTRFSQIAFEKDDVTSNTQPSGTINPTRDNSTGARRFELRGFPASVAFDYEIQAQGITALAPSKSFL
jgi:hypothetical protein